MSEKILFENKYISMYLDDSLPCIVKEWKGFTPKQAFKDILLSLVSLILEERKTYTNLKVVADSRQLKVLSPDTLDWLSNEIHPQYLKNGITKKAFVEPEDYFGKVSLEFYISQSNKNGEIEMAMFKDLDEAKNWLLQ